jgi:hypothetical protein
MNLRIWHEQVENISQYTRARVRTCCRYYKTVRLTQTNKHEYNQSNFGQFTESSSTSAVLFLQNSEQSS